MEVKRGKEKVGGQKKFFVGIVDRFIPTKSIPAF
jgi:hypothetical protein